MSTFTAIRQPEPSPTRHRSGKRGFKNASRCRQSRARPNDPMVKLRCKKPDEVRKELLAHPMAYKLRRTVMAVAADRERHRATAGELQGGQAGRTVFSRGNQTTGQ